MVNVLFAAERRHLARIHLPSAVAMPRRHAAAPPPRQSDNRAP
ncbi:MAG TPA: hypothetical protein VM261_11590 [Kofleriaceae bacterium]|nr:hypothetical protein [Kofleriaceae bacterium]